MTDAPARDTIRIYCAAACALRRDAVAVAPKAVLRRMAPASRPRPPRRVIPPALAVAIASRSHYLDRRRAAPPGPRGAMRGPSLVPSPSPCRPRAAADRRAWIVRQRSDPVLCVGAASGAWRSGSDPPNGARFMRYATANFALVALRPRLRKARQNSSASIRLLLKGSPLAGSQSPVAVPSSCSCFER